MKRFGSLILAGGLAKRMGGRPKSELILSGKTFLEIMEDLLEGYKPGYVSVMKKGMIPERNFFQVPDFVIEKGPLGGIYSVLRVSEVDKLITLPCDMPFMTNDVIDYVVSEYCGEDVFTLSDTSGREYPLCGIYTTGCLAAIEEMMEADILKVRVLRQKVKSRVLQVPEYFNQKGWMRNVNTPQEYEVCKTGT